MTTAEWTLEQQREEFCGRKFLAMPIAGAVAWLIAGVCGAVFSTTFAKSMSIFVCTGMILYLAMGIARLTGEDLMGKTRRKNTFDSFFLLCVFQAVLVYSIAIPFFMLERESLPLSVGILTGLMWIPFTGFIGHWVGLFHALSRTSLVLALWYLLPDYRFTAIPLAIVVVYLVTIVILVRRRTAA